MKLVLTLVMFAVGLAAQKPTWPKEPDGFKGARFLMSKSEVAKIRELKEDTDCIVDTDVQAHCDDSVTVDDRPWKVQFWFVEDQLVYVTGAFDSDTFAHVKLAFVGKYGMPKRVWESNVRTALGVVYAQESLLWRGRKAMLSLVKYDKEANHGYFMFGVLSAMASDSSKSAEAMRKALEP